MTQAGFRGMLADQALGFSLESGETLAGKFRPLDRLTVRHETLSGGVSVEVVREIVRAGRCVVVIPYDPASDSVVLVRQFRIGAALATEHAAPLELPAGLLDAGETPAEAAGRELYEETGLRARAVEHCFSILSSPGLTDEMAMVFLAIVDASALPPVGGQADENEDILPVLAPVDDLVEAVDEGRIANGFLFASLQWFARRGRAMAQILADSIEDPED